MTNFNQSLIDYIHLIPEDITLEQGGKYLKEIRKQVKCILPTPDRGGSAQAEQPTCKESLQVQPSEIPDNDYFPAFSRWWSEYIGKVKVEIGFEAGWNARSPKPVSGYAGGDSETHLSAPSDAGSRSPDGRVMGVLPTPAPPYQPGDWAYMIESGYISSPAEHAFDQFIEKASNAHTIDIHMRADGKDFYCQGDFLKYAKKSRPFLAQPLRESVNHDLIEEIMSIIDGNMTTDAANAILGRFELRRRSSDD